MRITNAFSRLLAAMALLVMASILAPSAADAHAGHAHTAAPIAQDETHSGHEAAPAVPHVSLVTAPSPDPPAELCTTNCCAAGMRCCTALGAMLGEIVPPQVRRLRLGLFVDVLAGIEPGVPLKPPRSTMLPRSRTA